MLPFDRKKLAEEHRNKIPGTAPETKIKFSKNVNELQDLCAENALAKLTPSDWEVLFETDEEN